LYLGWRFTLRTSFMPCANWHLSPYLQVPCSWKGRHISVLYLEDCWPPWDCWEEESGELGELAWLWGLECGLPHPTGHSLSRRDRESPREEEGETTEELWPSGSDWSHGEPI